MNYNKLLKFTENGKNAIVTPRIVGHGVYDEYIPDAISCFDEYPIESVTLILNGIELVIPKGMSIDKAIQKYKDVIAEKFEQEKTEREAWIKTPEGQEYLKKQADEKKNHDEYVYHSFEEIMDAISKVEPVNLVDGSLSNEDAIKFSQEVLTILLKSQDFSYKLSAAESHQLTDALKAIGCVNYRSAHRKYKTTDYAPINKTVSLSGNIEFPLLCFELLIDAPNSAKLSDNFVKLIDGDVEYSLIGQWLKAQEPEFQKQPGSDEN